MQETRRSGTRLRFLWLRSFDPGIAVRVDMDDDGARLTAAKLTGYGGGQAGSLATRINSKLSPDQVEQIKTRIESDSLWKLPLHHKRTDGMVTFDGAEWVMEISEPGRYHIVKRMSGREIERLGLLLLQLSDLDTEPIY